MSESDQEFLDKIKADVLTATKGLIYPTTYKLDRIVVNFSINLCPETEEPVYVGI